MHSRVGNTLELIGFSETLTDINYNWLCNPVRKLSCGYAAAELIWYASGSDDVDMISKYALSYQNFAESDGTAHGAYGKRIKTGSAGNQIDNVIKCLKKHPNSRQAIVSIWWPSDLKHAVALDRKDLPCTLTLQFLVRNDKLHLVANMRSNDVWLGMPYDIFCFTTLQKLIACELELGYGSYTHNVGSLHLYDKNESKARESIRADAYILPLMKLSSQERWSNFGLVTMHERKLRESPEKFALPSVMTNHYKFFTDLTYACHNKLDPENPLTPNNEVWRYANH